MKKSTGIIRKVDELGRVVLPKELRDKFKINEKDSLEIYTEGNEIILKKYENSCVFCGSIDRLIPYCDKFVCTRCCEKIKNGI